MGFWEKKGAGRRIEKEREVEKETGGCFHNLPVYLIVIEARDRTVAIVRKELLRDPVRGIDALEVVEWCWWCCGRCSGRFHAYDRGGGRGGCGAGSVEKRDSAEEQEGGGEERGKRVRSPHLDLYTLYGGLNEWIGLSGVCKTTYTWGARFGESFGESGLDG